MWDKYELWKRLLRFSKKDFPSGPKIYPCSNYKLTLFFVLYIYKIKNFILESIMVYYLIGTSLLQKGTEETWKKVQAEAGVGQNNSPNGSGKPINVIYTFYYLAIYFSSKKTLSIWETLISFGLWKANYPRSIHKSKVISRRLRSRSTKWINPIEVSKSIPERKEEVMIFEDRNSMY